MVLNITGFILLSVSALTKIVLTAITAEKCHRSILAIAASLKEAKKYIQDPNETTDVQILIEAIGSVEPFTGGGFFNVEQKGKQFSSEQGRRWILRANVPVGWFRIFLKYFFRSAGSGLNPRKYGIR